MTADLMVFADEPSARAARTQPDSGSAPYLVLIADDEPDVHAVTHMVLRDFDLDGHGLKLLDAHSEAETRQAFLDNPDIAVVLLDVVMDHRDSGLRMVEWIRNQMGNTMVRIILRTGQPGDAPETSVIKLYDINDYKLKTELTQQRLFTTLYSSLRSWRDMVQLQKSRMNLQRIVQAGSQLFSAQSLDDFLRSMLQQVSHLYQDDMGSVMLRMGQGDAARAEPAGFILKAENQTCEIVAATGRYRAYTGRLFNRDQLAETIIPLDILHNPRPGELVRVVDRGIIIYSRIVNENGRHLIFLEEAPSRLDMDQVQLFLTNFSLTLDNFYLDHYVRGLQEDILFTFGEVVEKHFHESSNHVKRVSLMMRSFAEARGMGPDQCELYRVASILHDIGKIGVPDRVLKKPGRLDGDEMVIMREHAELGFKILSRSDLPLFRTAASIARSHHEKWDGSGYPQGLGGADIPLEARMLSIVDVFDALVNSRIYKEAWPPEQSIQEIRSMAGTAFDPDLVDTFISNIQTMLDIQVQNP